MNTRLGSVLEGPLIWETASTMEGALFMVLVLDYGANGTQRNGRSRAKKAPKLGLGCCNAFGSCFASHPDGKVEVGHPAGPKS